MFLYNEGRGKTYQYDSAVMVQRISREPSIGSAWCRETLKSLGQLYVRSFIFLLVRRVIPVVPYLGSIEPQRFGVSVSGAWRLQILSNKSNENKIHDTHVIFPTTKGSMNACMELIGFSNSNEVKNHCVRPWNWLQRHIDIWYVLNTQHADQISLRWIDEAIHVNYDKCPYGSCFFFF